MRNRLNNIPIWIINSITVISGVITIIAPIIASLTFIVNRSMPNTIVIATVVVLIMFIIILFIRLKKYRSLAENRMKITSDNYHKLLCEARDTYFDIMHEHKKNTLTIDGLTALYKEKLIKMLDHLCKILGSFTNRDISACIKLICYDNENEDIDINNAKLVTFCRSSGSNTDRNSYEKKMPILLKDNTDFNDIISTDTDKDYFYQKNLKDYAKQLKKLNRSYRNTNELWESYYTGTIVVPIRIEFRRLYHIKREDAYHIIGFLCVDSLNEDAFTEKQEKYNVDIVRSFADLIYILLGQYRHYLKKLTSDSSI